MLRGLVGLGSARHLVLWLPLEKSSFEKLAPNDFEFSELSDATWWKLLVVQAAVEHHRST